MSDYLHVHLLQIYWAMLIEWDFFGLNNRHFLRFREYHLVILYIIFFVGLSKFVNPIFTEVFASNYISTCTSPLSLRNSACSSIWWMYNKVRNFINNSYDISGRSVENFLLFIGPTIFVNRGSKSMSSFFLETNRI